MNKNYPIYLLFFLTVQLMFSQVESNYYPEGNAREADTIIEIDHKAERTTSMPNFNVNVLIEEDKRIESLEEDRPYRFGKGFDVNMVVDVLGFLFKFNQVGY